MKHPANFHGGIYQGTRRSRVMQRHKGAKRLFEVDLDTGALRRISPYGKRLVLPVTLRKRVLQLMHNTRMGGHPGGRKLYQTILQAYYWPSLPLDC